MGYQIVLCTVDSLIMVCWRSTESQPVTLSWFQVFIFSDLWWNQWELNEYILLCIFKNSTRHLLIPLDTLNPWKTCSCVLWITEDKVRNQCKMEYKLFLLYEHSWTVSYNSSPNLGNAWNFLLLVQLRQQSEHHGIWRKSKYISLLLSDIVGWRLIYGRVPNFRFQMIGL